jgi:hypothetical protein
MFTYIFAGQSMRILFLIRLRDQFSVYVRSFYGLFEDLVVSNERHQMSMIQGHKYIQ